MAIPIPFTKRDLKTAIYQAFKDQSTATSGISIDSYSAISREIGTAVSNYCLYQLYKIKLALIIPGAYTAPGNVPPVNAGPLAPGAIVAAFADVPEAETDEEENQQFAEWKETQPIMALVDKTILIQEIERSFSDRTLEPANGDADLAYKKIAETMGEAVSGYVLNEMNKIKLALVRPDAFAAAAAVVNPGSITAYEPGQPSGPFP